MDTVRELVRAMVGEAGGGADVPLDVFRVSAEVGCVVDFVLEELYNAVSKMHCTESENGSSVDIQYQ